MRAIKTLLILFTSLSAWGQTISDSNKDVFILSTLIRGHLRKTDARAFTLDDLVQYDTLNRVSNNFEKIETKSRGGHIAIAYKFSKSRDTQRIKLSDEETEAIKTIRWNAKPLNNQYDGEMQFDYGERGYRIRKIIVKKNAGS